MRAKPATILTRVCPHCGKYLSLGNAEKHMTACALKPFHGRR